MILCLCEAVPARKVLEVIDAGARSLDEIEKQCGAGRDCGSCHQRLGEMLAERSSQPSPGGSGRGLVCAQEP
jgi:bacterioferritin-associated ferredoxin